MFFKLCLAVRQLVVAKHDDIAGVKLSHIFHLRLKSAAVKVGDCRKSLSAQGGAELFGLLLGHFCPWERCICRGA